ncbi:uncharacterized protein LOC119555860 [Drosophila subpulchrella]|uniref:uncharacterized protein LOC119555860 n=1 Tax=Drosophila subpulchrella TaxID=1486046 RepID=UPI0018A154BA|nr:uncharacterized protein LOC119555860 [Drosophila subpulchrella]
MAGQRFLIVLITASICWASSIPGISAKSCGSRLQLRSQNDPIDLSGLSEKQLQQLLQQLAKLQTTKEDGDDADLAEDEEDQDKDQDLEDPENDHRGGSRPWNRVQRIIRRQLVRIPKRYLKKFLRQFGLARSIGYSDLRSTNIMPQPEEYYLIPLE